MGAPFTTGVIAISTSDSDRSAGPDRFPTSVDILIAGAGIAGLAFALSLPLSARVLLVTKGAIGESNTRYAQGGLAAAVGESDTPELHLQDTLAAGAGLVDTDAARALVEAGKTSVEWLIERGTEFDRTSGQLELGKEGAHSRSRVLHAGGDATGAEIERALVAQLASRHDLTVLQHTALIDLRIDEGRCVGAELVDVTTGRCTSVSSAVTVLALGGAGRLWAVTSNPAGATGDGIAVALRSGVTVADLEFTQFHPTVLDLPEAEPFLISEAVRGDGAYLRNGAGERFMLAIDARAELAPRDVVARAIQAQIAAGSRVWLDLTHLDADLMRHRFPTINRHLREVGIDMATDPIPVAPAAHYFMGGIAASPEGRTSLPGLLAIGEVSCTGVHGANRLASNSLLEGLVFGRNAASSITPDALGSAPMEPVATAGTLSLAQDATVEWVRRRVQEIMRDDVSVVRSADSLTDALRQIGALEAEPGLRADTLQARSVRDMLLLAREIATSALRREESRGGHYRVDFPERDPALDHRHQLVTVGPDGGATRTFGDLSQAWSARGAIA
jgi:L-aspartate oxidase